MDDVPANPDLRREQIMDAFTRIALSQGLSAATMRAVAAEAGVSLRLVQYYFGTKAALVGAALERMEGTSVARWKERATLQRDAPGQELAPILHALSAEALPDDAESLAFHRLWLSLVVQAGVDADIPVAFVRAGPRRLEDELCALFVQHGSYRSAGSEAEARDRARELLALLHGLGTAMVAGLYGPDEAKRIVQAHLRRLTVPRKD